jgi:hypothetical protein
MSVLEEALAEHYLRNAIDLLLEISGDSEWEVLLGCGFSVDSTHFRYFMDGRMWLSISHYRLLQA